MRFSETQIGFEIPRILATSNVALQLLHTRYDHITPLFPTAITEEKQNSMGAEQFNDEESTEKAMTEEKLVTEEKAANEDEQPKTEQERELNLVQEENKYDATENTVLQKVGYSARQSAICLYSRIGSPSWLQTYSSPLASALQGPAAGLTYSQQLLVCLVHWQVPGGILKIFS